MATLGSQSFTEKIHHLIAELQSADNELRTNRSVDGPVLRELRHALDNLRLTAWTASELQNARDTRKDTDAMAAFLAAERFRRIRRMIDDFCSDLEHDDRSWPSTSLNDLQDSIGVLRERLGVLSLRRQRSGS